MPEANPCLVPGRSVLGGPHRLQRPVIFAPRTRSPGPTSRYLAADIRPARQLLRQSLIRQLYRPRRIPDPYSPTSSTALSRMAQYAMVFQPHLQPLRRINRHHGQAMAK